MKKALIVTTVSGFVAQFEMNNVKLLQNLGYQVHYASNFRKPGYGRDNHRLKGTKICCHQVDFVRSPFKIKKNITAYFQLKKIMQREQFSLIHCHTPMGAVLARLAAHKYQKNGTKVIYTAHGFHFYQGAPLKNWLLYYPAECFFAGFTDVLITINKEDYKRALHFCRHKKTQVKYMPGAGIDTSYWSGKDLNIEEREKIRSKIRKELKIKKNEFGFLSIGELTSRKNHKTVIKALAKLNQNNKNMPSFQYFICGQGVLKKKLLKWIETENLQEKIHLLGYREDIRELLYGMDVFLFPSLQEGMPMALMEAMAAGILIVASNIRGNKELAKNSGILLENKDDIENWSKSIKKIVEITPQERTLMIQKNQKRVMAFDKENIKKIMYEIYRNLTKELDEI